MTFPLGSANLLLLHRELWCSRRASLTKTTSTRSRRLRARGRGGNPRLGQGISSDDCSARTHTEGGAWTCSVSLYLLFSAFFPAVIPTLRHRRIHRSDKAGQQRCRNKDRNWPKGGIPVSPSSPVSAFHQRHERPVRVKIPIPKPRSGAVSRTAA